MSSIRYSRVDQDQLVVGTEQGSWVFGVQFLGMVGAETRVCGSDVDIERYRELCGTNHIGVDQPHPGGPYKLYVRYWNDGGQCRLQVNPGDYLVFDAEDPTNAPPTVIPQKHGLLVLKQRPGHNPRATQ